MIDDLALLLVHGCLAILVYRLITTSDPGDPDKPKASPLDKFRRGRPGADG